VGHVVGLGQMKTEILVGETEGKLSLEGPNRMSTSEDNNRMYLKEISDGVVGASSWDGVQRQAFVKTVTKFWVKNEGNSLSR